MLLGVKGTLSEAELFTLRTRLYEGRWNKARKGLLRFPLPVGYVRAVEGGWVLDPDTQVREILEIHQERSFDRLSFQIECVDESAGKPAEPTRGYLR